MRSWSVWGILVLAAAMLCPLVSAQNEPGTPKGGDVKKPEKTPARKVTTKPAKGAEDDAPKLLVPTNKIKTLTPEQLAKLRAIAEQAEKDKEAIMERAREASFALLTPEQKTELASFKEKAQAAAALRKEQAAKRREERQKAKAERAKLKGQKKPKTGEGAGAGAAKP